MSFQQLRSRTTDLIFPRRCPVCDRPVKPFGGIVCADCAGACERVGNRACRICGKPTEGSPTGICPDCSRTPHAFHRGAAVFVYSSIRKSLYRFKYAGREEYAAWFGLEMADRMVRMLGYTPDTLLVPVPVSARRMKERGYNQAALLAREIGRRTGLEVNETSLLRTKDTPPLKTLDAAQRRKILQNAFHTYGNVVESRRVVLIDDIYTTGATIDSCARSLLLAGAREVDFTALAAGEQDDYDQRTEGQTDDQDVYL